MATQVAVCGATAGVLQGVREGVRPSDALTAKTWQEMSMMSADF